MRDFLSDLVYGWRVLAKKPGFAAAAILALALGIGANTAIFSVLDAVVLQPLPYLEPDQLISIWENNDVDAVKHSQLSPVNFLDYRSLEIFQDATAWWYPEVNLTDEENEPVRVNTIEAATNFFEVLGVSPIVGRAFTPYETLFGPELELIISHALWQGRYGSSPEVLGQVVQMNGTPYTIVGVAPPEFNFPGETDAWQQLRWDMSQHSRFAHFMESVARLRPDVEIDEANNALRGLSGQLETEFARSNKGWYARGVTLKDEVIGVFNQALLILFGAVGLLLLLACANVANLLLARAAAREREVAVRAAIGAGRARLLRQFLTEALVMAAIGGTLGIGLAYLAVYGLLLRSGIDIPRLAELQLDPKVLLFSLAVTGITTLLFGMVPAFHLSRTNLQSVLKEGGRSGLAGGAGRRLRSVLVVAEVALAVVLLVGAGLLVRSFLALTKEDPGFQPSQVVSLSVALPGGSYGNWTGVAQFFGQFLDNLNAHPAIESAGATGYLPLQHSWRVNFGVQDRPPLPVEERPLAQYRSVSPHYFRTLSIPLIKGRFFETSDSVQSPGVVVINESMARRHWPDSDPIDDVIISGSTGFGPLGRSLMQERLYRIVGVVGDVKNNSLGADVEPEIFFSQRQFPYRNMSVLVRGSGNSAQLLSIVKKELQTLDPALPLADTQMLENVLVQSVSQPRFIMQLMALFAGLALALAAVGIYGVLSYLVSHRKHEIGIRMALGARPRQVQSLVIGQGLVMTTIGISLGGLAAAGLTRYMASLLYGVGTFDIATFGVVAIVILLVSVAACHAPARRAGHVDPIVVLRDQE